MSESKRKIFTGAQKAKIALEAVRGTKTINEIAQEHSVHPTQVSQCAERSGSTVCQNRAVEYGTGLAKKSLDSAYRSTSRLDNEHQTKQKRLS